MSGYLDWPHAQQVFQVHRRRTASGETTEETAYGITSLPPERADAAALLGMVRGHWGIENRLHHVRDVTFGEDACRVRSGQAPRLLAAMRNLSIGLLHRAGWKNKAAALRRHAARPREALNLIRGSPEN